MAKHPTRIERSATALVEHPHGISGREIDFKYAINSGRNEVAEIERLLGFRLDRTEHPNQHGTGYYTVYRASKNQAHALIKFINGKRTARGAEPLSQAESAALLAGFSEGE